MKLDYERERHWRIVFEENCGGVDDKKAFLYSKRWDVYLNEKENLINGGYSLEVVDHYWKKFCW